MAFSISSVFTPAEIAVSISAQLVNERAALAEKDEFEVLPQTNVDPDFIGFMAGSDEPKALLTVIESGGSTPVKPGAVMAVNRLGQTFGTIGGGCSENEVLGTARHMIGTGEKRAVFIDMSNDVAEDEGMVCGGHMTVLIEDMQ